jgi:hypothetical protein
MAAASGADNRAVGDYSAVFERGMPGELAGVHLKPTVRLTGGPTGRHGATAAGLSRYSYNGVSRTKMPRNRLSRVPFSNSGMKPDSLSIDRL